jgi:hypothetical protein
VKQDILEQEMQDVDMQDHLDFSEQLQYFSETQINSTNDFTVIPEIL